jgi:hypothetical protein
MEPITLTDIQKEALKKMNEGFYLLRNGKKEGIGMIYTISTVTKAGTIDKLMSYGLIRRSIGKAPGKGVIEKFVLTNEGRFYRHHEK